MSETKNTSKEVRTRFAPSPTGSMHIGNLRTALFAYALARHNKGKFILRIEDTDKKREVIGGIEEIVKLLKRFKLVWDGDYIVQSDRVIQGVYKKAVVENLVNSGHAFYCQCKPKNAKEEGFSTELRDPCRDKKLTNGAIKLRVSDGEKITFHDFVLDKDISWETSTVPDTTLLKSDGYPTYHLAVVVDDHDMKITHVLRGHDWMPSTPIHLLVYKYLGYDRPEIGHLTDILDPEGGKLSKRKGSTSCEGLLKEGYLPEAILNFIMLLGWAPKDNRELFTLDEFVNAFDPKGFQKANPVFNKQKLDWFNGEYIRKIEDKNLSSQICNFYEMKYPLNLIEKTIPLVKDRINKLSDYWNLAGFFFEERVADKSLFVDKSKDRLENALKTLESLSNWEKESIDTSLMSLVKEKGYKTGDFFMDLRIAIAGSKFTPPINDSILILGKEKTLEKLRKSIN